LVDRIIRIEKEMSTIRKELADLRQQRTTARIVTFRSWADKEEQRRWIRDLFVTLSIQGVPLGAEVLQQRMGQAGLAPNELSRDLIKAREE